MRNKFNVLELLPVLSIGLVDGIIVIPLITSFAILIFSGELATFATTGIGMVLFGGLSAINNWTNQLNPWNDRCSPG